MEVDLLDQVVQVAEATCLVLDPLYLGVDAFARGVGDAEVE